MDDNFQAWQRQLLREYEKICWYHRVPLRTPLLVISEGRGRAGCWRARPEPGVLELGGWLIRERGWDVVIEVLKHEMSHQYVEQVLGRSSGEPPHGPAFQEACRRLGVHPLFRRAQGEIPRLHPKKRATATAAPIIARIEKLLALAGSANEHEASLAMTKAGELMRRHNLERLAAGAAAGGAAAGGGTDPADVYDYLVISSGRQRRPSHHLYLAALLRDFFYVKTINYALFDPASGRDHQVLELLGTKENLVVAEYVYHFLEGQLERLWRHYRTGNRATGRERNSFYVGILSGFREKLARQEQAAGSTGVTIPPAAPRPARMDPALAAPTCSALVCGQDLDLLDFFHNRYPRLRTVRGQGPRLYRDSYQAGQSQGRRIVIQKGINRQDGNRGRLLA